MVGKYKVITLCGSTRFKEQFLEAQKRLTLEGNIVISVGLFGHSGDDEVWTEGTKEMLDDMHKRKIDMADAIYVINVDGYIGSSTRSEIEYAVETGKEVLYLEDHFDVRMKRVVVKQLMADVISKFGRSPELDDYQELADLLNVSPSLLRRYICGPEKGLVMRERTLSGFSQYVGYKDFKEYKERKVNGGELVFVIDGKQYDAQQAKALAESDNQSENSSESLIFGSHDLLKGISLEDPVTEAFCKKVVDGGYYAHLMRDDLIAQFYKSSVFGDNSSFKFEALKELFFFLVDRQKIQNSVECFALFILRFSGRDILCSGDEFYSKKITWLTPSNSDTLPFFIERLINDQNGSPKAGDSDKWKKTANFFSYPAGVIDREKLRGYARKYREGKPPGDEFTIRLDKLIDKLIRW